jgi:hypothetical protein
MRDRSIKGRGKRNALEKIVLEGLPLVKRGVFQYSPGHGEGRDGKRSSPSMRRKA